MHHKRAVRLSATHLFFSSLCAVLCFPLPTAYAQLTQPARYERDHKANAYDYTVIPMNEQGLALIHQVNKFESGDNFWEVVLLDSALQQTWSTEIKLNSLLD